MSNPKLSSETVHASCVAVDGRAILIGGRSGSGKSDLSLRLVDRGAQLVSDDYTLVRRVQDRLLASAPESIAGRIEVRGVGIVEYPPASDVPVSLFVDLDLAIERLPEPDTQRFVAGLPIPLIGVNALEASAPIKVEAALKLIGLEHPSSAD